MVDDPLKEWRDNVRAATINTDARRLVLPPHKASCHITHNQHLAYYETVREMFEGGDGRNPADFVSDEEREKAYALNEMWEVQWYPDTPVGFCVAFASSLEALNRHFEAMNGNQA